MRAVVFAAVLGLAACSTPAQPPVQPPADSWVFGNSVVQMTAERRFGGSVTHVLVAGFDYDNLVDHGREWQVAYQLDGQNEGENPTEAGSAADAAGPTSSTVILSASTPAPNQFISCVHGAYWYPYAGAVVSPDTICKTVTVGLPGLQNVIEWKVGIDVVSPHTEGHFEPLAGYYPILSAFYVKQPGEAWAAAVSTDGETDLPPDAWIAASPDGTHALGMLGVAKLGLTWNQPDFLHSGTSAFGCGWISEPLAAGHYEMTCYVALGTLGEVEAALNSLAGANAP